MFAVSFYKGWDINLIGASLFLLCYFHKGWEIDLIVASLCLLYRFTNVGIYIFMCRPYVCCVILPRLGYTGKSYGYVLVFAVSFYKFRDIKILWLCLCACCIFLQRLGNRSYLGILVFAVSFYKGWDILEDMESG